MENVCKSCAMQGTDRCPYFTGERPQSIEFGCFRYVKIVQAYNDKQRPSSCGRCRFLFRKPKEESADKSFVMCGCIPSLTRKVQPEPNCPNFKPIRKKQVQKRAFKKFKNGRGAK